ncbi:MAG: hypothetical protein HY906_04325 [Deltaproteobacteria bacterium]|nr:hypothetical protein [Deltaproteobacteria bacterium]
MAKGAERFGNPLELIGDTPVVPVRRLPIPGTDRPVGEKPGVEVWAKVEGFNPGGSTTRPSPSRAAAGCGSTSSPISSSASSSRT